MHAGLGDGWALLGAGVLASDAAMRERLAGRDFLTTVVERSAGSSAARVTGPMIGFPPAGDAPAGDAPAVIAALADPAIRIMSLTITEGGRCIDAATGAFTPAHPSMAADAKAPDAPTATFGQIAAGTAPPAVMSCGNTPRNGRVTRDAAARLAAPSDPELGARALGSVALPSGMVEPITPATSQRERAMLRREVGIEDAYPVFREDFIQRALEDDRPAERPALEEIGVRIAPDVSPYELMEIRILNGGHAIIACRARLMDIHFVQEAMENPLIAGFLAALETSEALPTVPASPGMDLAECFGMPRTRLANSKIGDTVRRLCHGGANRRPEFIIPTIAARLAAGAAVEGLALESALRARHRRSASGAARTLQAGSGARRARRPA
jgi:mannitol 2-dehydrogenase